MKELSLVINKALRDIGVPAHIYGYTYIKSAIELLHEDRTYIYSMTKRLYPDIAALNGTTASRVERAIRHAVSVPCDGYGYETLQDMLGSITPLKRGQPTNSAFLAGLHEYVEEQMEAAL